jgi:pimeloyl-ACP methyl ester carboxylesterase
VDERSHVEVRGGPVEVLVIDGDRSANPLVFLHEGLGSIDLWRGVPHEIAAAVGNPLTVVYARHGYGRSGPADLPRPVAYMHHEADVVLPDLLDRLGIERPVLIGHSDGASIALAFAGAVAPVAGLVCLAPHVFVEPETIAGIEAARATFESTDLAEKLDRYHADPVATFRGWNDVWLSPSFLDWNIEDRLATIDVPTLLIQGDADDYGTFAQLDAIERGVRGPVERLEIAGAGHAPHLDARDTVVTAIAEFIGRLPVGSG